MPWRVTGCEISESHRECQPMLQFADLVTAATGAAFCHRAPP